MQHSRPACHPIMKCHSVACRQDGADLKEVLHQTTQGLLPASSLRWSFPISSNPWESHPCAGSSPLGLGLLGVLCPTHPPEPAPRALFGSRALTKTHLLGASSKPRKSYPLPPVCRNYFYPQWDIVPLCQHDRELGAPRKALGWKGS